MFQIKNTNYIYGEQENMSNSVVKVTESSLNDSLFLLVGEDGTVTPDRKTVESFLSKYIHNVLNYLKHLP